VCLPPTKEKVLDRYNQLKGKSENIIRPELNRITGFDFYNLSKMDFEKLLDDPNHIAQNLTSYINAFSKNVRDIMERFEFGQEILKMAEKNLLYQVVQAFTREIRLSERKFYQKITDIYATALDYDPSATATKRFFAAVQNKMHYAIHGSTAAEVIVDRADHKKKHMGLANWEGAPKEKIHKYDVSIAKNYLSEFELGQMRRIVSAYLDMAEMQAMRKIPMTMEDWEKRLGGFLKLWDREILQDAGKVTAELAKTYEESEFEKYRIVQDKLFESDFDKEIKKLIHKRSGEKKGERY